MIPGLGRCTQNITLCCINLNQISVAVYFEYGVFDIHPTVVCGFRDRGCIGQTLLSHLLEALVASDFGSLAALRAAAWSFLGSGRFGWRWFSWVIKIGEDLGEPANEQGTGAISLGALGKLAVGRGRGIGYAAKESQGLTYLVDNGGRRQGT